MFFSRIISYCQDKDQRLSTRTQRDHQYQENPDKEEGTLEQGLPWLNEPQPLLSHPPHYMPAPPPPHQNPRST